MALLGIIYKQPREILDFDVNYTKVLSDRTSTLISTSSEVLPIGLTLVSTTLYPLDKIVKVVISGGTNGSTYKVTILTDTDDGLKYEDEVTVIIKEV